MAEYVRAVKERHQAGQRPLQAGERGGGIRMLADAAGMLETEPADARDPSEAAARQQPTGQPEEGGEPGSKRLKSAEQRGALSGQRQCGGLRCTGRRVPSVPV